MWCWQAMFFYLIFRGISDLNTMTLQQLKHDVAKGEGLFIEFKLKLPEWDKLMREVVAFANTEGGTVYIGVDDDGRLVGERDPREVEEVLPGKIEAYCRPVPDFRLSRIPISPKRAVVAIRVRRSLCKPLLVLPEPNAAKGLAVIRIKDSSVTASREMFALLKYEGRERDMKVEFGDKERVLMQFLEEKGQVTVAEFALVAKIGKQVASRTLVHLVKANVLRIVPGVDQRDRFLRLHS